MTKKIALTASFTNTLFTFSMFYVKIDILRSISCYMKVYRKIYATQKAQRYLMITVCAWLLSALEISPVGLRLSAFLAVASVVLGIICLSRNNVARKDMLHETRELNIEQMNKVTRVLFLCCMSGAAIGVVLCAVLCKKDFSSTYGTLVYIANVLLPLQLMFVPAYSKAALKAASESSVEKPVTMAEPKSQILRGHNVCLLVIAFLVSYIMLFYAAPKLYKGSAQFRTAQNDYLQNDISEAVKYKSETLEKCDMGGLLQTLPGAASQRGFSKDGDSVTVTYTASEDNEKRHAETVYNATALFALTDNLREINFVYGNDVVTVLRADAVGCYDDFAQILNEWQMKVSYELRNAETVETRFAKMTKTNGK